MANYDCDVVISGLGPVGATLAALLVDMGLTVIILEKEAGVFPLPRAAHIDHEIMRVFQQIGIAEAIESAVRPAAPYEFRAANGDLLLRFDPAIGPKPSGWANSYMIYQPGIEAALRAKLAGSSLAECRLGQAVTAVTQDENGVVAHIQSANGPDQVRGRYLVACDGASSPIREALGINLTDFQFDEPWLVVDVLVKDKTKLPDVNLQMCDPARPTTCIQMSEGRHRWEFMLLPGETADMMLETHMVASLLAKWHVGDSVEIERRAVYRFHGLIADKWRDGRIFLAGDAAHQMPPFAGQGMCSGIRDVANLAWKLHAVISDNAKPDLLDTYQLERAPHVQFFINTATAMGKMVCMLDPAAAAMRNAAMTAQMTTGVRPSPLTPPPFAHGAMLAGSPQAGSLFPQPWSNDEKMDDVLSSGTWLLSRAPWDSGDGFTTIQSLHLDDPLLADFSGALQDWLDMAGVESVLVRPDRYVFGTGRPAELLKAYAAHMSN
jgi:3-(3-hydroxy-phenyl)propionate hydroxylase